MAATFGWAVEQVQLAEGVLDDEAKALLNQEHKRLVVRAHLRKRRVELSTDDSAFRIWDFPDDFRELVSLTADVDGGTREYSKPVDESTMTGIRSGRLTATFQYEGLYAKYTGTGATKHVEIWPALEDGNTLEAVIATEPADLVDDADEFSCPDESVDVLIDMVTARIRRRHDDDLNAFQIARDDFDLEVGRLLEVDNTEMGADHGEFTIDGVDS